MWTVCGTVCALGGGPLHPPIPLLGGPGVKHFFPPPSQLPPPLNSWTERGVLSAARAWSSVIPHFGTALPALHARASAWARRAPRPMRGDEAHHASRILPWKLSPGPSFAPSRECYSMPHPSSLFLRGCPLPPDDVGRFGRDGAHLALPYSSPFHPAPSHSFFILPTRPSPAYSAQPHSPSIPPPLRSPPFVPPPAPLSLPLPPSSSWRQGKSPPPDSPSSVLPMPFLPSPEPSPIALTAPSY